MSIPTLLWQTSSNNSTWVDMKTPSEFKHSWEDLDHDSYRSVVSGNLIRSVIRRRWIKVSLTFNYLTSEELDTIVRAVNTSTVYFKMKSPAFGNSTQTPSGAEGKWLSFEGYVSKFEAELLQGQVGWSLSFNIIQSKGASWQV